jgi:hypothetical protein
MNAKSFTPKYFSIPLLLIVVFLSGCLKDKYTMTYTLMYPVYADKSEIIASINSDPQSTIKNPGKLFIYGKYIFLNEIDKGVHIIDNSNPARPKPIRFLKIPGSLDMAVKGSTLYADMYSDLLSIDISDPLKATVKKITPSVFPERFYSSGFAPEQGKIIVDWIKKDTTVEVNRNYGRPMFECINCSFALASDMGGSKSSGGAPGVAGSMARLSIVGEFLYAVNQAELVTMKITNPQSPEILTTSSIGWNIETIFPFKNKLFIGSASGMFLFNIDNPSQPLLEGSFSHATACDPVVADDKYAFVTLRSGSNCQGFNNQLDIVDVTNVNAPVLVKTYTMSNPHGLAKDGNTLFICDGADGLKVFDASNVFSLKMLHHIKNMETYDVIAWNKNLLLVTKEGLLQFDYSDLKNIRQISKLSISRN